MNHRLLPLPFLFSLTFALLLNESPANETIGIAERFALADDRAAVIDELVPGTEEFYFLSALLAQQEGRLDDVEQLLEPWVQRHGETARVNEIRHRQALLRYGENPGEALPYLKKHLGLRFEHQQEKLDARPDFPTSLNEDWIRYEAFLQRANDPRSLAGISDGGLDSLIRRQVELNEAKRKELLQRLRYPDYEQLVGMIAADLRTESSRGFGEYQIHRRLTLAQLDELMGLRPELIRDAAFVDTKLVRLRPGGDVSLERDEEARRAWVNRLWDFVRDLDPAFNSLKASVLYRHLDLERREGRYPLNRFLDYLQLPRPVAYMEPRFLEEATLRGAGVDLNRDFRDTTGFAPIRNDEALVREYLEHFFREDDSINRFSPFIRESYLRKVFAETKLVHGIGDAQRWFPMLSPAAVEQLKDRVEISFAPTNRVQFSSDDEVRLDLDVKNVKELIVKVYQINTLNYYLDQKKEINTDLNLDGLVANEETTYRYDNPPVRLHRESFTFESMKGKRGVWVVEFIGNGISSRALIRKGKLQYLSTTTPGGEMVRILTEANLPAENPAIRFGGKRYEAGEDGLVRLPFSTQGRAPVILEDGDFSSLANVDLPGESYSLNLGAMLPRETLLPGKEARIILRPQLTLRGEPVSTGLLENVHLRVTTIDQDGVESVSEEKDFALFDERESIHTFRVPARLRSVTATLQAEVAKVSGDGKPEQFSRSVQFDVNGTSTTAGVADVFLSRFSGAYVLEVLGKSGEALADHLVDVTLRHPDFTRPFQTKLKTGPAGKIAMGTLGGLSELSVSIGGIPPRTWNLEEERYTHGSTIHATPGEEIVIPHPAVGEQVERKNVAVFEMRNGVLVHDLIEKAKAVEGAVVLSGLAPGDYEVVLRGTEEKTIRVLVTDSESSAFGYHLSKDRHLQESDTSPMRIEAVEREGEELKIRVGKPGPRTRVHLLATRFLPEVDAFQQSALPFPLYEIGRGTNESLFLSGRDIGEEYRYILERRASRQYPGNMLPRPGLILNPWELNRTETAIDEAEVGEAYRKSAADREMTRRSAAPAAPKPAVDPQEPAVLTSSFDFLRDGAVVLANLVPGDDGVISIPLEELGDRHFVTVVAVGEDRIATRSKALEDRGTTFRDLRLQSSLDLEKTFTRKRNVTLLEKGAMLTVDDLRAAELATYGTVGEVYDALSAISQSEEFLRFGFVRNWSGLPAQEKRKLYSEFASHELNFFLSRKDEAFFNTVVKPYLANKKDKTFLDHYLLGNNLERFLAPWEFGRLNVVERILLGRRIGGEQASLTAGHVQSLHDLLPVDPNRSAMIYRKALRGQRARAEGVAGLPVIAAGRALAPGGGAAGEAGKTVAFSNVTPEPATPVAADGFALEAVEADEGMIRGRGAGSRRMLGLRDARQLQEEAKEEALYRRLESTKEWAENNYYHLPIEQQNGDLITTNAFWLDFAGWDGQGGFYSREFPEATRNLTEMMFALSLLDLPFAAEEYSIEVEENTLRFTANSPVVIFHEEIEEAERSEEAAPVLISQNFFRADDRYVFEGGVQIDKFVTDEFLTGVVYGSQVVATNPTSSPRTLELLVQIPEGSIPVNRSDYLKSYPLFLDAFSTSQLEVQFYFPSASGEEPFDVYPVQVSMDEQVIASGAAQQFTVVEKPTRFDETSWKYLSQYGTNEEVLDYLSSANLHRIRLDLIAWRVRENVDFFRRVTDLISSRHGFDQTLWSYGLHHNVTPLAREFLKHREDFLSRCGRWLECELASLDPVERHWYQHLEYAPLVNARAHRLGRERSILNDRFREQYGEFLELLCYKPDLDPEDELAVTAYLLLQDRIGEAIERLERIDPEEVTSRLQYDYLSAYTALYREEPEEAGKLAAAYLEYPVERWQNRFAGIDRQVKEISAEAAGQPAGEEREEQLDRLSASEPFFDLSATGREAEISFRNLGEVTVNYYEMDLEFLFSSQPFVSGGSGQFSYIRPNFSEQKQLPDGQGAFRFEVPERFASSNVLVEVVGAGKTKSVAVYSNRLKVQLSDRYGRVEVSHQESGKPIPKTYVKVYARMKDGDVRFFKDGYTDLRGRFDYVSLNTDELDQVEQLSLLVMSEEDGSLVREVEPPQR